MIRTITKKLLAVASRRNAIALFAILSVLYYSYTVSRDSGVHVAIFGGVMVLPSDFYLMPTWGSDRGTHLLGDHDQQVTVGMISEVPSYITKNLEKAKSAEREQCGIRLRSGIDSTYLYDDKNWMYLVKVKDSTLNQLTQEVCATRKKTPERS